MLEEDLLVANESMNERQGSTTNIVCVGGGNTGILHSAIRHLITGATARSAYRLIVSSRSQFDVDSFRRSIPKDSSIDVAWLPLDLANLTSVRNFPAAVERVLQDVGEGAGDDCKGRCEIDVLILNAAVFCTNVSIGRHGWTQEAVVNHFSQYYLAQLLIPLMVPVSLSITSGELTTRIVVITSAKYSSIESLESLEAVLRGQHASTSMQRYAASKFVQLVGAHALAVQLAVKSIDVVAISPGFVPTSDLSRDASRMGRFFMKHVISLFPFATSLSSAGEALIDIITLPSARLRSFRITQQELGRATPASPLIYFDKDGDCVPLDDRILLAGEEWTPSNAVLEDWFSN